MTDVNFPLAADSDFEDLPRTLRREKEARAREARERHERERRSMAAGLGEPSSYMARTGGAPVLYGDDPVAVAVHRFDVPFFHLVRFFLKAAIAAIPALILLGVILYLAGQGLATYYPDLVRMKILIAFSGG